MPRLFLSPPDSSELDREFLLDAFDSNWLAPLGPHVDAFEREFSEIVGVSQAVALSSGTAALQLALDLLNVGPGDRVVTSTLTFVATANAVRYRGAEPIFVDSDAATWNMDADLLREALASLHKKGTPPKAVIAVDLYGQCADYDRIVPVCQEYGVPLIEDAAEALGATYRDRSAGQFGVMAAFSFNGNKIITTSGGGMLTTERADWAERARFLATQARDPAPHYEHSTLGYNFRLSNLLAALGRAQLRRLEQKVAARRTHFAFYKEYLGQLPGWSFMPEPAPCKSTRWLTCALLDEQAFGAGPEEVREALAREDIEARPVWKPMHLQPLYRECVCFGGSVAEELFSSGLCLPSGSGMTASDRSRVVETIYSVAGRH